MPPPSLPFLLLFPLLVALVLVPSCAQRGWPRPSREASLEGFELIATHAPAGNGSRDPCGGDGDVTCVPDVCGSSRAILHGRLAPGATQVNELHQPRPAPATGQEKPEKEITPPSACPLRALSPSRPLAHSHSLPPPPTFLPPRRLCGRAALCT
jgi:hypothetical protein